MSKSGFSVIIVLVCVAASLTFAQSLLSPFTANQPKTGANTNTPVLSPDDFKSHVKDLNKQTQADLAQQLSQTLAKQPAKALPPPPTPPTQQPTTTPSTTDNAATTAAPAAPEQAAAAPATPAESAPTESASDTSTFSAPPAQSQVYTGFGAGTSNNNAGSTNNKSSNTGTSSAPPSGNLGIKY